LYILPVHGSHPLHFDVTLAYMVSLPETRLPAGTAFWLTLLLASTCALATSQAFMAQATPFP
jgi:hypothetical protein